MASEGPSGVRRAAGGGAAERECKARAVLEERLNAAAPAAASRCRNEPVRVLMAEEDRAGC